MFCTRISWRMMHHGMKKTKTKPFYSLRILSKLYLLTRSTVDDHPILPRSPLLHSPSRLRPSQRSNIPFIPPNSTPHQHARLFSTSRRLSVPTSKPDDGKLTHLTSTSEIHIVPISSKSVTTRHATAVGYVSFHSPEVLARVRSAALRKGDVLVVARVAGIQAAKRTSDIVPLCHPGVQLEGVRCWVEAVDGIGAAKEENEEVEGEGEGDEVDMKLKEYLAAPLGSHGGIRLAATVTCSGKTGVEMEALCAVAGAGLCVLDMVKGIDRCAALEGIHNVRKSGGRSGLWCAEGWEES